MTPDGLQEKGNTCLHWNGTGMVALHEGPVEGL